MLDGQNKCVSNFNFFGKYPPPVIEDDNDINSTNVNEIDIRVDDANSVNFFIGAWVLVIY